jgi:hypothetical protein
MFSARRTPQKSIAGAFGQVSMGLEAGDAAVVPGDGGGLSSFRSLLCPEGFTHRDVSNFEHIAAGCPAILGVRSGVS